MNNDILLRIRDVLCCLSSSKNYNVNLGRLEIQKIIYLMDSIGAYLLVLSSDKSHETYYYGPYDKNIQGALDALIIRGMINATCVNVSGSGISSDHAITAIGKEWFRSVLEHSKSIQYRYKIAESLIYSLIRRNLLKKIKALVYAEPMYVDKKPLGNHYELNFASENSGHTYLTFVEYYLSANNLFDVKFTVDLYVDYLFTRSELLSGHLVEETEDEFI